jgi:hypothetical protein
VSHLSACLTYIHPYYSNLFAARLCCGPVASCNTLLCIKVNLVETLILELIEFKYYYSIKCFN